MDKGLIGRDKAASDARLEGRTMILLCGGEGAAGVKTGGAFFLLVSYAGPNSDRDGHGAAAHEKAVRLMPVEDVGAYQSKPAAPARRGLLHSV